jgi:hypothetical protein
MEELQIAITALELKIQDIEVTIGKLMDYGNVPECNFNEAHDLLIEWKKLKLAIKEMEEVEDAIRHNNR